MGYIGEEKLADSLVEELKRRGLAKDSEDGVSIPVHPLVRYLVLALLAQILRPQGIGRGLLLSPTTDRSEVVHALTEILSFPTVPSAGHVVAFDLQTVAVDLSAVPLDEVLSFRAQHLSQHRNYANSIRRFALELAGREQAERDLAFRERQSELDDLASDLRRKAYAAWRAPASFALGLAGASWTYATGDIMAALLGGGAVLVGGVNKSANEAGAFSYLFAANKRFA
jgi:hypothetical protein